MLDRLRRRRASDSASPVAGGTRIGAVVAAGGIPVIREVEDWVVAGSYRQAVLLAYPTALYDAERALGLPAAPGLTHPECMLRIAQAGNENLATSLGMLYELYRPVRYGPPSWETTSATVDDVVVLLQDIYGHGTMWLSGARGRPAARAPPGGATPRSPRSEESTRPSAHNR